MRHWITKDTHIGHKNIQTFCNRPANCDALIFAGLSVLEKGDVITHLGDVAFRDRGEEEYFLNIPTGVRKWLVLGNHDKSAKYHLESGWDWVGHSMSIRRFGKLITFFHKPAPIGEADIQFYGHFHNNPIENCEGYLTSLLTPKHHLLAIEYMDYKPELLDTLIKERINDKG